MVLGKDDWKDASNLAILSVTLTTDWNKYFFFKSNNKYTILRSYDFIWYICDALPFKLTGNH